MLGPAVDGGYWLIAMREARPEPFHEIPWSTPAVFGVTLERCEEAGLRVAVLEPWRDIDTLVDLDFLFDGIDRLAAPRTRAVVRELADVGVIGAPPGAPPGRERARRGYAVAGRRPTTVWPIEDGGETSYTYLAAPRAVFVVPVTTDGELVFVRQYRHPVRDWTLEVPAGTVEDGESPLDAARRELAEEAGGTAAGVASPDHVLLVERAPQPSLGCLSRDRGDPRHAASGHGGGGYARPATGQRGTTSGSGRRASGGSDGARRAPGRTVPGGELRRRGVALAERGSDVLVAVVDDGQLEPAAGA